MSIISIICTCIGCGCDDLHACVSANGPCSWLIKDSSSGLGVCSSCPADLKRWHRGDRKPSTKALLGEALHIIAEEREMIFSSCSVPGTRRVPNPYDCAEIRKLDRWIKHTRAAIK